MPKDKVIPFNYFNSGQLDNWTVGKFLNRPIISENIKGTHTYQVYVVPHDDKDSESIEMPIKIYKTSLGIGAVKGLIKLAMITISTKQMWHEREDFLKGDNNASATFANCYHFGLAIPKDKKSKDKNASGVWSLTNLGAKFCNLNNNNLEAIPKYCIRIKNNIARGVVAFQGPMITNRDLKPFDDVEYRKMMCYS